MQPGGVHDSLGTLESGERATRKAARSDHAGLRGRNESRGGSRDHGMQGGDRLLARTRSEKDPEGTFVMDDDKMPAATLSTLKLLRTRAPSAEAKKLAPDSNTHLR